MPIYNEMVRLFYKKCNDLCLTVLFRYLYYKQHKTHNKFGDKVRQRQSKK